VLKKGERLRGQAKNCVHAQFFRHGFGAHGELGANAPMFMRRIDLEARQLRLLVSRVRGDGNAANNVVVDFEDKILVDCVFR